MLTSRLKNPLAADEIEVMFLKPAVVDMVSYEAGLCAVIKRADYPRLKQLEMIEDLKADEGEKRGRGRPRKIEAEKSETSETSEIETAKPDGE